MKFITNQVVLAHNFVQIYTTLSEQQRINQELYFTRQLQSSLIPKKFPVWDQFVVHSFTRSAKEVNGDFYDFVEIDEDRLLLVVGDASGKGIPACMMMAMTRSFIRANIGRFTTLENLLFELNSNLYRDTDDERYITLAFCLMDRKRSTIDYARAGHTPLILFRDSAIHTIFPDGSALGLVPNELTHFDILSFEFRRDTTLLIFSDGISEALNDHDEEYGLSNLCKVFENACRNQMAPDAIIGKVLQDVDAFADPARGQTDDQTMVIVKHL
jgi:serine phosphatase RsbU (regulator of sigma subunit)